MVSCMRDAPSQEKEKSQSPLYLISSTLCASTTAKRPLLATGICPHGRVRARVSTRLCLCVQLEKKASVCSSMPLLTDLVCRKSRSCVLPLLGRRVAPTKQSVLCFALLACLLACLVWSVCLALLLLFLLFFLLHLLRLATVTATATPPATKMLQSRIVAGDNTLAGKQVALV